MTNQLIDIPLSKLVRSSRNARRLGAKDDVGELAASIEAHGLLQNLAVRQVSKGNGKKTDAYEVIAGARRLAALQKLAKRKRIPKDFKVPCRVIAEGAELEASLAENVKRKPLHPADEFAAFSSLQAEGYGAEEIAARFGVSPTLVLQRLKLAAVSPRLIAAYRAEEMTLDQLMAFAITDDHAAQERVWFESPQHDKDPRSIRRALTKALVAGEDRRARFVGAEAYEAAGGTIIRDLFDNASEGYFADSQLLDRLVSEKLSAAAEAIKAEGWSWVDVLPERDYVALGRMGRVHPSQEPLPEDIQAKVDALAAEYDAVIEEHGEDPPEEIRQRLDRISDELDSLSASKVSWSEEDKARAGAIVSIDPSGNLSVERGLVKPSPKGAKAPKAAGEAGSRGARSPHSESLLEDLSAHRTAALRETLVGQPTIALAALVYTLALRTFFGNDRETCLDVRLDAADLGVSAEGIGESPAVVAFAKRHRSWSERLPPEPEFWDWILAQDRKTILGLLAYCAATSVNALVRRFDQDREERQREANLFATTTGLDMAQWWQPTREHYLSRVSKSQVLKAVAEAVSPQAAENIAGMKKEAMVARAEELLAGKGWLPEPLRVPTNSSARPA